MRHAIGRAWSGHHQMSAAAVAKTCCARMPILFHAIRLHIRINYATSHGRRSSTAVSAMATGKKPQQLAPTPRPLLAAEAAFYAESAKSFEELGIIESLADALKAAGFIKPSRVQELAVPPIISGRDVVLAAETGSGKTLAYIAPVASVLLHKAAAAAAKAAAAGAAAEATAGSSSRRQAKQMALILCPNTALCQQVIRLVQSLKTPADNKTLLHACQISSANPPPFESPDIVVTTPGALVGIFNDRGHSYGPQWTAEGVSNRAVFVVVDEADLLCQGGYQKDLTRLLDAFKSGERRVIESQVMAELSMSEEQFSKLPRNIKQACWEGGVPAMRKAGFKFGSSSSSRQQQKEDPEDSPQQQQQQEEEGLQYSQQQQQRYGPYFKRQYLFIAATMPAVTKADVGTELQKRFKNAVWVSGDMLHQIKPHVDHTWVQLAVKGAAAAAGNNSSSRSSSDAVCEALVDVIKADAEYQAGNARMLVFTMNTKNANEYSEYLTEHGIPNVLYHKDIPKDDRDAALATMAAAAATTDGVSSSTGNLVMVSTDAASRGIDLPNTTHVIQADFAINAIEFLHRVGRTARAGKDGKVTSLYGQSDRVLAEAIKQYVEEGRPIEECFSRNRSFSSKVRKYGKFVPRGQPGPDKRKNQQDR